MSEQPQTTVKQDEPVTPEKPTKTDWLTWLCTRLTVTDKHSEIVPFVPNTIQVQILKEAFTQWRAGYPVRLIILKPRQVGVSTVVQALFFAIAQTKPHINVLVAAHDQTGSTTVFRKAKFFHKWLPSTEVKPLDHDNTKALQWSEPHGSRFEVQVATGNLGRGNTLQLFHASELAFWDDAATSFQSAIDTMPKDAPGSAVIIESTANGDSGEFYIRWKKAVQHKRKHSKDLNCFLPLFYSWLDHEEYQMDLPIDGLGELDEEEQWLRDEKHATERQLAWRRYVIEQEFAGDIEKFHQDYPTTWQQAFLMSGSAKIDPAIREHHHQTEREPIYGKLAWADSRMKTVYWIETGYDPTGCWRLWLEPRPVRAYAVGADVSEGIPCDPNNPRSDLDKSAIMVINRRTLETCAMWVGYMDPDLFGEEIAKAGYWYNLAWVNPEINNAGHSSLDTLRRLNYPYLCARMKDIEDIDLGIRNQLGWRTTSTNRSELIDKYVAKCRKSRDPEIGWRDSIKCYSQELADEEDSFVRKKTGKIEHKEGCHDDILFATMLACICHDFCQMPAEGEAVIATQQLGAEFIGGYAGHKSYPKPVVLETS